jgi:uncharacterized membrane protein YiaA
VQTIKTVNNMTREQQVFYCRQCQNRKASDQGLLCSVTGEKAAFENECTEFKVDEKVAPAGKSSYGVKNRRNKFARAGLAFLLTGVALFAIGMLTFDWDAWKAQIYTQAYSYGLFGVAAPIDKSGPGLPEIIMVTGLISGGLGLLLLLAGLVKKLMPVSVASAAEASETATASVISSNAAAWSHGIQKPANKFAIAGFVFILVNVAMSFLARLTFDGEAHYARTHGYGGITVSEVFGVMAYVLLGIGILLLLAGLIKHPANKFSVAGFVFILLNVAMFLLARLTFDEAAEIARIEGYGGQTASGIFNVMTSVTLVASIVLLLIGLFKKTANNK